MAITVESPSASGGRPATARHQKAPDLGRREEQALHALVKAGMSTQTAMEQIVRLAAGDIWSG
ncbi:hypothetical protein SAT01_33420 [Sinomonas atrocyanea]|uniref:hypothetical protein n=1 Tax=Sinomonas atrocyanea TaxID=37927 RepID=UPI000836CA48|nr:hypothetical protein [Sinomonas atrocyanea]GEB65894.1 hypothetical protein SAT01_33420 [Sinomonas atrocyanea]GGG74800.1 hypothetical protein GCM10007172_29440 [Sinomonas atrocyanea]